MRKSTVSYGEAAIVTVICFGLFIVASIDAVASGFPTARFSDSGHVWGIGLEIIFASAALVYLYLRGFDIASLYPKPSWKGSLVGVGLFIASWVIAAIAVTPFYSTTNPQLIEFSYSRASLPSVIAFAMVNGAFEEVFLLGVLVRGLRGYGLSIAVGLPLLIRLLYHIYQGPLGAIWILAFGTTFSVVYLRSQQLWPPVLAHILWDIVPFVGATA